MIKTIKKKITNINKKYINLLKLINFKKIKKNFFYIKKKINKQNIWSKKKKNKKLIKKYYNLKKKIDNILLIKKIIKNISKINKKYNKKYIEKNIKKIKRKIFDIKIKFFLYKKKDKKNCYIKIKSGYGGIESQNWSLIILKMYIKWAEKNNFKTKILKKKTGEKVGIKSALILIIGKYAYGYLKYENGIHKLIRENPFKIKKKIQTSFSSVITYPEEKRNNNILNIKPSEIKINVYKSSKSGGQHANKTESAVRIKHIKTGIISKSKRNRSQFKNKIIAIKQLKKKIIENKKKNKKKININWNNKIRSYIYNKNIIKDFKSNIKIKNINKVLNGDINIFIKKNLEINYRKKNE